MTGARRRAFVALFDAHWDEVVAFLRRRVRDPQEAEELASDVFRVAWEKQDPDAPFQRAWLYSVALNKLRNHYRHHDRRGSAEAALVRRAEESPDGLHIDERLALEQAMASLPAREREALRLTYWEGLAASEVAAVLDLRVGTVWTLLTRARNKLKAALSDPATVGGER
jgi:RNA polymerase sigma-70 factor (ECF subfamily)